MDKKNKIVITIVVIIIVAVGGFVFLRSNNKSVNKQIDLSKKSVESTTPINPADVSYLSGLACDNKQRRAVAVMQPSDLQARPAAGFSEADMVFEMPAYTSSVTRLMGVYVCNLPPAIGAIRSARHDYMALAKGLDAVFIHWGASHFAQNLLNENIIDHVDCLAYEGKYCSRWDWKNDPVMRMEDSGHVTSDSVTSAIKDLGFRAENKFVGYPHQEEAPLDQRPNGGHLRVAFANPYDATYDYDKTTNSYLRTWNTTPDTDRNNKQRLAPKNIVVMFAKSEQITNTQDYVGQGLQDPWKGIEEIKNTGVESISGRYNNVEIGDPWYDNTDTGEAHYYMNGQEYVGTWKKDKSSMDSKLFFYDSSGQEIKFVPGQIWVEVLEPGQNLKWAQSDTSTVTNAATPTTPATPAAKVVPKTPVTP